jgi:hypothetical protein
MVMDILGRQQSELGDQGTRLTLRDADPGNRISRNFNTIHLTEHLVSGGGRIGLRPASDRRVSRVDAGECRTISLEWHMLVACCGWSAR